MFLRSNASEQMRTSCLLTPVKRTLGNGVLSLLVMGAVVMGGCAGPKELIITEPVGPFPTALPSQGGEGNLIVFSGWDGLDTLDAEHLKHTPYVICSEEGKRLK